MDSNRFVVYFRVYWSIYFVFGILFQFFLFFLILTKSPSNLQSLKLFLYNTWLVQCIVICLQFATQNRTLPNSTSLAVLPDGLCQRISPSACFIGYHLALAFSLDVALSIANTVAFRFLVLRRDVTQSNIQAMIFISHLPTIVMIITPFIDKWDFESVRAMTYAEHPTYNFTIYPDFPGFANIQSIPFILATGIIAIFSYGVPACSAMFTRLILVMINRNTSMSRRTKSTARMLVHGLACQTILPFLSYVPIVTGYLISQITNEEMILTEHFLNVCSGFPSLVDPLISFYFIIPYRHAIIQIFRKKNDLKIDAIGMSSVSVSARPPTTRMR